LALFRNKTTKTDQLRGYIKKSQIDLCHFKVLTRQNLKMIPNNKSQKIKIGTHKSFCSISF